MQLTDEHGTIAAIGTTAMAIADDVARTLTEDIHTEAERIVLATLDPEQGAFEHQVEIISSMLTSMVLALLAEDVLQ